MRQILTVVTCMCMMMAGGCGVQSMLLGTEGSYLLSAMDVLTLPNENIQLQARLQGGDLLRAQSGHVIRFYRDGKLFKVAETDSDGLAAVSFTPDHTGNYRFLVEVAKAGLEGKPPIPQELLVTSCQADAAMLIVDLDKTVVESGFHMVLIGNPVAMPMSVEVLQRLARTHTIVYLTHRPDYFGPKSKAWLDKNGYPPGPVLLSTVRGFLKGSGEYKSEMLKQMQKKFTNIEIGVGDKISDALAYYENGLKSFLIVQIPEKDSPDPYEDLADSLEKLPDEVQVVTSWEQIEQAIFNEHDFPRSDLEGQLREMEQDRRKKLESKK
jgi:hypothetical protein